MPVVTVKLNIADEILEELEAIAKRRNTSLSDIVSEILEAYVRDWARPTLDEQDEAKNI